MRMGCLPSCSSPSLRSRNTSVSVLALKRWKRPEVNKNGTVVKKDMHVTVGDTVQVIAGADKGTVTEVTAIRPATSEVTCKGVRVVTKHMKPQVEGESGQISKYENWIHSSNVMHYSKNKEVRSRIGFKYVRILCMHVSTFH